jgi:hypothetical protein
MNVDISQLLADWDYEPGKVVVRKFAGRDGRKKIQLRVDLGLLQMNDGGRPDGKRPFGHESLLEHYQAQLERHRAAHMGHDEGFTLKAEDCARLQQEAIQYHHRYICHFQLGEYEAVLRDTSRNVCAFDFVQQYAASHDLAWTLQQFRPQLLMMRIRAQGAAALEAKDHDGAICAVRNGIEELRSFYQSANRLDLLEHSGEIQSLQQWLEEIQSRKPMTEQERLENALSEAVAREDYEKAAQVRDALRKLNLPKR